MIFGNYNRIKRVPCSMETIAYTIILLASLVSANAAPLFQDDFKSSDKLDDSKWNISWRKYEPGIAEASIVDGILRLRVFRPGKKISVFTKEAFEIPNEGLLLETTFKYNSKEPGGEKYRWVGKPYFAYFYKKLTYSLYRFRFNSFDKKGVFIAAERLNSVIKTQYTIPGIPVDQWLTLRLLIKPRETCCELSGTLSGKIAEWTMKHDDFKKIKPIYRINSDGSWPPASIFVKSLTMSKQSSSSTPAAKQ